jgi:hypothetical protein
MEHLDRCSSVLAWCKKHYYYRSDRHPGWINVLMLEDRGAQTSGWPECELIPGYDGLLVGAGKSKEPFPLTLTPGSRTHT